MQYEFVSYSTLVRGRNNTAVCAVSFVEDMTRNKVVAVLKTHEQVRDLIEQLEAFAYPPPREARGMTEDQG